MGYEEKTRENFFSTLSVPLEVAPIGALVPVMRKDRIAHRASLV